MRVAFPACRETGRVLGNVTINARALNGNLMAVKPVPENENWVGGRGLRGTYHLTIVTTTPTWELPLQCQCACRGSPPALNLTVPGSA